MAGNTFGTLFRVTTSGVSHGPGYLCIVDGCPAGLELGVDDLLPDLQRRRPGQSKLTTQRDEADVPEIWSGIFEGKTDGTPIGILFRNGDHAARTTATSATNIVPAMPITRSMRSMASATTAGVAAPALAKPYAASQPVPSPRNFSPAGASASSATSRAWGM